MEETGCLSKSGSQEMPPSVVFQTPPFHAAIRFGIDLLGLNDETGRENKSAGEEKTREELVKRFHTNLRGINGTLHGITGGTRNYRR
jgi:hypothetical protein